MKGTRPLNNDEIRGVSACFDGIFEARNRGLFMIGVSTGGRISELLSLRVGDVFQNRKPVTDLLYSKSIVNGGEVSRAVPVNRDGRQVVDALICIPIIMGTPRTTIRSSHRDATRTMS